VDKLATARALEALDLPAPWTASADEAMPMEYPCILKPRLGSGSRGVMTVVDETDARFLARKFPGGVFQQLLDPHRGEVTCAVYRSRDGSVATLQLLRRLAGGLTGWAKVIRDPAVEALCAKLAQGLELSGSMNVQLRLTRQGPLVFEINPRFSSTALMRHRLGFSDVMWTLDELDGAAVSFCFVDEGRIAVRLHGAAVLE
jgi:carbamoyl-phosphate synthase large subunit